MSQEKLPIDLIHQELLGQLRDILRVCDTHQIPYNLMCGTLLGAVRHKGFIPWDDDIDLLMTRDAFARFEQVYPKECDPKYLLTYLNTWTPRVMSRDPQVADAFTDFFILDYLPPAGLRRKLRILHLRTLQGMLKENVDYSRFNWKNKLLIFGTHVLGLPFTRQWKVKRYFRVSSATKTGTEMHMSNGAFGLLTQVWRPEQFEEKMLVPFEDLQCLIPVRYDEVLTTLFGPDYMTPPPPEQQVAKHLDL